MVDLKEKLISYMKIVKDNEERIFTQKTLDFVGNNKNYLYRSNLEGHITNSAWITDSTFTYILLIHHKKLDKWFQPGGHCEEFDATLQNGAIREAKEETGLDNFKFKNQNIFDIDVHEIPEKGGEPKHFHYDIRFWLIGEIDGLKKIDKNEIIDAKWFHIDELKKMELSKSTSRMIKKTMGIK